MGAMPEEVSSIKSLMQDVSEIQHGSRCYYSGKIHSVDVILVFSRIGKVASSVTVASLITEFNVTHLIFTGVAGAVSSDLCIGDIVISSCLYQHDLDASPIFPKYEVPLTGCSYFNADPDLIKRTQTAAQVVAKSIQTKIDPAVLDELAIQQPSVFVGKIATGDQFIKTQQQTNTIVEDKPDTLAVEMEGAAVAQVCYEYGIPFVVMRTISDKADHLAPIDFIKFINEIATYYAEHIISHLLIEFKNTSYDTVPRSMKGNRS